MTKGKQGQPCLLFSQSSQNQLPGTNLVFMGGSQCEQDPSVGVGMDITEE